MTIIQTLQSWGNSAGIRLPKQVLLAAHLQLNQRLEITVKGGSVILSPLKEDVPSLGDMLAGVTPELVAGELDWGLDLGAENYE